MKWKKIGDILVVDDKFSNKSLDELKSIANKEKVESIIEIDNIYGVRPVISLKPSVELTGSGTMEDPWILSQ